jgi:hypothetical protein|tara:strand:- start:1531 stop:1758 length:228 start_codon:yes stop_codon:yes gene_type:complete
MAYDYAKKYYKNASPANKKRFNEIVDDLRIDMSFDSAINEGLRKIREEIRNTSGGKKFNTGGIILTKDNYYKDLL